LSFGKRYAYAATAEDTSGRISAPSAPLAVSFLAAPASPPGLAAQAGDKEVRLHWDAPTTLIDGVPASGELRYIVLRGAGEGGLAVGAGPPPPPPRPPPPPPTGTPRSRRRRHIAPRGGASVGTRGPPRAPPPPKPWRRRPSIPRRPRRPPGSWPSPPPTA